MGNLDIYDKVREVPENAQKIIGGGRLKGMTDINPVAYKGFNRAIRCMWYWLEV